MEEEAPRTESTAAYFFKPLYAPASVSIAGFVGPPVAVSLHLTDPQVAKKRDEAGVGLVSVACNHDFFDAKSFMKLARD